MMNTHLSATTFAPHKQRGVALLLLLTLVVLVASYALLRQLNREKPDILRAGDNAAVLARAKAALLGYALKSTVRPGELPCPDTDNDGNSNIGATCGAYLGRLPWRTLGLEDLRDTDGERLWYALDAAFDGTAPINSETMAGLSLNGAATRYVALVFAPGESLAGQARPQAATGNVSRYLEGDNANGDTNFVTTGVAPFNDQLMAISEAELLRAVERRVLGELKAKLTRYYADNRYYPAPAALNTTTCDSTVRQGHIPITIKASCGALAEWVTPLPAWFDNDGWNLQLWYAPAPACTQPTPNCSGVGFVDVRNTPATTNDKRAVLIAAGPVLPLGQNRPASALSDLLDSSENSDNINLVFEKLPIDAASNDRVLIVAP